MKTSVAFFIAFMTAWLISGFVLEYQIMNNLNKSGRSTLMFYSVTVIEQPPS